MFSTQQKYTSGKQWLIDTKYLDYQSLNKFLVPDPTQEYSYGTSAYFTKQYPLWCDSELAEKHYPHKRFENFVPHSQWNTEFEKITLWTQAKLIEHGVMKQITPVISWWVDYEPGGWQAVHTHNSNSITQIIYMDDPLMTNDTDAKDYCHGAMYSLLTDEKTIYLPLVGFKGRCVLMTGNVHHGVYPVKTTPRRAIIIDYII
jgi:hypothetical protein